MVEQGYALSEIAKRFGCSPSKITDWVREDKEKNGDIAAPIAVRYARAQEVRWAAMADEVLTLSDDRSYMGRPDAAAIVQQQRLAVDTRKWLLSKMMPRQFGDRIEVAGDADAPLVSRIELVAVHPREALTIEAVPSQGDQEPQKR